MENVYLKTDIQKMVRMSTEKCESLHFYKYLCQKIGSKEVVRMRRLALCISDMSELSGGGSIYSGSKGEGLDLKGSDLDLMFIDTNFKVYESETEVIWDGLTIPLIMNTEETKPCFTQLRLLNHQHLYQNFKYMWQKNHLGYMFSSEQYKLLILSAVFWLPELGNIWRIHGPCISDNNEQFDYANCLKCDQWIVQAKPWIVRARKTWPLPEVISKIDLYEQGINCFTSSDTLKHYERQSYNVIESLRNENVIKIIQNRPAFAGNGNIKKIIYHCLHHSRTGLSRSLFALYLSKACQFAPDASKYGYSSENKHQYYKYKYDRSHLLIGSHSDAVSGWLRLASFFYVHKKYFASLKVINHALQKYTDEKIFTGITAYDFKFIQKQKQELNLTTKENTCIQKHVLNLMKKEKPYSVLKELTIEALIFNMRSLTIPQELQLDAIELLLYDPLSFAYFISFLCYYHLHDMTSCRHYLQQIQSIISNLSVVNKKISVWSTPIMCCIAYKLIGETYSARQLFQEIVDNNPRLSLLSSVILH
ncbi:unnamed protein product [Mytilus coruscus]|uniref:Mab-21-like HhH/H2TH-like domain-containing protein n=1 Tax=Mytilus coruscus TaxID=42192 RepID=A0A6J8CA55_MYTCO|nr:unnamed protein product [Mytilus coruscus]